MEALTTAGGVLMIATAGYQAMMLLYRVVVRRVRTSRLDGEFLRLLRDLSTSATSYNKSLEQNNRPAWQGARKFQIAWRGYETPDKDTCSFYLVPSDRKSIPTFKPGQFLTFELDIPGQTQKTMRCYSLSDSPSHQEFYRITVKRMRTPANAPQGTRPGLSSSHFHEDMQVGDVVDVHAPSGSFCLDQNSNRPVVLVAGGVGITPLLSMLNTLIASGSKREIWLFYGVTNRLDHAMYDHLQSVNREMPNLNVVTFYCNPRRTCRMGTDYDIEGFVRVECMKPLLRARNYEFYVCGPPPMMKTIVTDLQKWGVPLEDIQTESFGSASKPANAKSEVADGGNAKQKVAITFSKSNKTVEWTPGKGSLLELAESAGIRARFACRAGVCGTCVTALLEGQVKYDQPPTKVPAEGHCLLCVAQPKTDLTLEL